MIILYYKFLYKIKPIFSLSASYINYFILPIVVTLMWSGNIGLAIRNLIKEKEKFIEEVRVFKSFLGKNLIIKKELKKDDESNGLKTWNQLVGLVFKHIHSNVNSVSDC